MRSKNIDTQITRLSDDGTKKVNLPVIGRHLIPKDGKGTSEFNFVIRGNGKENSVISLDPIYQNIET